MNKKDLLKWAANGKSDADEAMRIVARKFKNNPKQIDFHGKTVEELRTFLIELESFMTANFLERLEKTPELSEKRMCSLKILVGAGTLTLSEEMAQSNRRGFYKEGQSVRAVK